MLEISTVVRCRKRHEYAGGFATYGLSLKVKIQQQLNDSYATQYVEEYNYERI